MIDLLIGIVVGLIPAVGLFVWSYRVARELDAADADYDDLKAHGYQLCSELEFERKKSVSISQLYAEQTARADAEAERASINSVRIQQLQDELEKATAKERWREQTAARVKSEAEDKLARISAIIDGDEIDEEDE